MRAATRLRTLALGLALVPLGACGEELPADGGEQAAGAKSFSTNGVVGQALQKVVLQRAEGIAPQNRPYVFNGVQDCYGYVRQVWNAVLTDGKPHEEDFYPKAYNRSRWLSAKEGLPVNDAPSSAWVHFASASELVPGDALATDQGHRWGSNWHGGVYAGKTAAGQRQWDNTTDSVGSGAFNRPLWSGFRYYYRPTHELLSGSASQPGPQPPSEPDATPEGPQPDGAYQPIVARHSGKCLAVAGASTANKAKVWQYACDGMPAQGWKAEAVGGDRYRLVSQLSGKCLDVPGASTSPGEALWQYTCNGSAAQRWKLESAGDGHYSLVAQCSGLCLDVANAKTEDQTDVIQWSCHDATNQQWRLSLGQADPGGADASCPPDGTTFADPAALGDLSGRTCLYQCWGSGTLFNSCGAGMWQFCLPTGVFASCQKKP
jgi:hypothetical protein